MRVMIDLNVFVDYLQMRAPMRISIGYAQILRLRPRISRFSLKQETRDSAISKTPWLRAWQKLPHAILS